MLLDNDYKICLLFMFNSKKNIYVIIKKIRQTNYLFFFDL